MALADIDLHRSAAHLSVNAQILNYSQDELATLYQEIGQRLEGVKLKDINVARKLSLLLKQAERMHTDGLNDKGIPYNQRVQGQSSLSSIISSLAKLQIKAYESEQNKRMESALMKTLQSFPAIREKFLTLYSVIAEEELDEAGIND